MLTDSVWWSTRSRSPSAHFAATHRDRGIVATAAIFRICHARCVRAAVGHGGPVSGVSAFRRAAESEHLRRRWVRSVKQECLSRFILFGERSLQRALTEFIAHFHSERNHQGKRNVLLFPAQAAECRRRTVRCRERLGGLLPYDCRAARILWPSEVLNSKVIGTDDTSVKVLDRKLPFARMGWMWPYVGDAQHPVIVYDYTPNRSRAGPGKFLEG
jgi:hypothetical protein